MPSGNRYQIAVTHGGLQNSRNTRGRPQGGFDDREDGPIPLASPSARPMMYLHDMTALRARRCILALLPTKPRTTHDPLPVLPPAPPAARSRQRCPLPVGRIFCVGRKLPRPRHRDGRAPVDKATMQPFYFIRTPPSWNPAPPSYPPGTCDLQHEMELVVAIRRRGLPRLGRPRPSTSWATPAASMMTRRRDPCPGCPRGRPPMGPWPRTSNTPRCSVGDNAQGRA